MIKFHDQMKPIKFMNLKPEIISNQVRRTIEKELTQK